MIVPLGLQGGGALSEAMRILTRALEIEETDVDAYAGIAGARSRIP